MARLSAPKRIIKEDFEEKFQELVDKLAYSINTFHDEVFAAFNKNINIDNLSREILALNVENDSDGNLKIPVEFKTSLSNRMLGINIINAQNLTNSNTYPINAPFISWTMNKNILSIKKVTGIQNNNKYRLTLELIT